MRATCPACGFGKEVGDALAGKTVRCPQCREKFRIAEAAGEFEVVEAAAPGRTRKQGWPLWAKVLLGLAMVPVVACAGYFALIFAIVTAQTQPSNSTKAFGTVGASIGAVTGS